ncbi:hypothetical protein [Nonomuraea glycinis]|uniref:hypothetical protein n=1 Tax=Nonomuraea glycinis TaxID=2047744 RepID=UPI0033B7240A
MTRLMRQALVVIYEARFPTGPTWASGPLVLHHRQVRSTAEARSEYFSAKSARVLYGSEERPNRWHDSSRQTIGDFEIMGVEALRTADQPDACGLVAIHIRPRQCLPIELLRTLAGRRGTLPLEFDPEKLLDGQAVITPGSRPYTVAFVTPAKSGLPRLYRQIRYRRWPLAHQWLWSLASRTSLADYPPDPKNLEPTDSEVIRLSGDWHAVVLRDGMGVVGVRADQGRDDTFFGYAELYLRTIYLDAIMLGLLQKQGLTLLEERMVTALDSSAAATMAKLEQEVSSFRHRLWAQHLAPNGAPNRLLTAFQQQHALRERFDQILTEISDFNRLTRDDENRHINGAVVVFTLVTVPAGIALALLQVMETDQPWLIAAVVLACLGLTVLLLSTRSARVAFRALRNRFTLR